jgi:hypothetical protein
MIDLFILILAKAACLFVKLTTRLLLVAIYLALLLGRHSNFYIFRANLSRLIKSFLKY